MRISINASERDSFLKTADITPAFKKGDKHDKSNQTTDQ